MKHIGMLKTTGTKVILAYRTLPQDPLSSLVIDRDAMLPFEEDIIEGLLESKDGQDAFEFAHVLGRHRMPLEDSQNEIVQDQATSVQGVTVLEHLHTTGKLLKQATENVMVTEQGADAVQLDKLNEMIASQRGVDLAGLSIQPDTTSAGTSGKNEAKLMLARADRLEKKMLVLKERAYELDPELRPRKGRPKKSKDEE
mgnify:FL=1|tara:strand:+ start:737 stop:1330 length:594 start_codon:yes stop_codon:yes gene_type:complete